ncbi:MAG: DUF2510 domain-containing protein [Nocardioidaceae bacterium]
MAKRAGWYPDPWGGQGYRWWDGNVWSEHVQDQPGPIPSMTHPGLMLGGPISSVGAVRPWWQQWWFIALMLFFCCFPLGLVLIWMRDSTPVWVKLLATGLAFAFNILLGLFVQHLFYPDLVTS